MATRTAWMALSLLVVGATAQAEPARIPKDMQGIWCSAGPGGAYFRGDCDAPEAEMEVTASGFNVVDSQCKALQVSKFNVYPWGRRGPMNPWGPGYRITFRCIGEGRSVVNTQEWRIEKGSLVTEVIEAHKR